ncbi:MAG: hypothetical protein WEA58_09335 [Balneolaceae bacterium]
MLLKNRSLYQKITLATLTLFLGTTSVAFAHVKWFSDFSFDDRPLPLLEAVGPLFIGFTILTMVVLVVMVFLDEKLNNWTLYNQIDEWLSERKENSLLIMRIVVGATLLLSWQGDAILVPELSITSGWIGWAQFVLAFMLLFDRMVKYAGAGLILLYLYTVINFGFFHMLDYLLFGGAGYYLMVSDSSNVKLRESRLPALYATVGFSLCWLAIEKIIYPQWALYILEQNPQLTLGFDVEFFLIGAAFVEFALGYLLIICLLQRPLALVITLVFFTTTLVFGKVEVIGHTLAHGALIVFLLNGPGNVYKAPVRFHKKIGLRAAFTSINFLVLLTFLITAYSYSAFHQYEERHNEYIEQAVIDVSDEENIPSIKLQITEDELNGWNLRIETEEFKFTPQVSGSEHKMGEGHAHLYINNRKTDRIYGEWYHIYELPPGSYTIRVVLNTNNHKEYRVNSEVISDEIELTVE